MIILFPVQEVPVSNLTRILSPSRRFCNPPQFLPANGGLARKNMQRQSPSISSSSLAIMSFDIIGVWPEELLSVTLHYHRPYISDWLRTSSSPQLFAVSSAHPKSPGPEIGTSSIDWAQLSRFYLKTETEFSLRNVVFWKRNRTTF
jgi:hypothetical protein